MVPAIARAAAFTSRMPGLLSLSRRCALPALRSSKGWAAHATSSAQAHQGAWGTLIPCMVPNYRRIAPPPIDEDECPSYTVNLFRKPVYKFG